MIVQTTFSQECIRKWQGLATAIAVMFGVLTIMFASILTVQKYLDDTITMTNPFVYLAIICFVGFFIMEIFYGDLLNST